MCSPSVMVRGERGECSQSSVAPYKGHCTLPTLQTRLYAPSQLVTQLQFNVWLLYSICCDSYSSRDFQMHREIETGLCLLVHFIANDLSCRWDQMHVFKEFKWKVIGLWVDLLMWLALKIAPWKRSLLQKKVLFNAPTRLCNHKPLKNKTTRESASRSTCDRLRRTLSHHVNYASHGSGAVLNSIEGSQLVFDGQFDET